MTDAEQGDMLAMIRVLRRQYDDARKVYERDLAGNTNRKAAVSHTMEMQGMRDELAQAERTYNAAMGRPWWAEVSLDALAQPEGTDLAVPVDILSDEWWEREVGEAK